MNSSVDGFISKSWGEYTLDLWKLNKECSSFISARISAFISNIPFVTSFLTYSFNYNDYVASIVKGLNVCQDVCKSVRITTIKDENVYENK